MIKRSLALLMAVVLMAAVLVISVSAEEMEGSGNTSLITEEGGTGGGGDEGGTGGSSDEGGTGGSSDEGGTGGSGSEGDTGGSGDEGGTGGSGSEDDTGGSDDEGGTGGNGSEDGTGGSGDEGGTDGSGSEGASGSCTHAWIYVEVPSTCTEFGAKGYYCSICEAVTGEALPLASHTYDHACDTSCNVCGGTREITHKFSTQWSKNSTKHWHACTVCGAKDGEGNHYPGPAATEEKAQYCLTCGLMMMPQKSHTHTYSKEYTSDETGHWYACSGCDEKKDFQMHTYDNLCDPDCNDCGYTTQTAHSFNEENWKFDETGHWVDCIICGEKKPIEIHIPGPEATDVTPQLCSVCGYELVPALDHAHIPGNNWEQDENNHWKVCTCGEKLEAAAHAWDSGTEQEDGSVTYVCVDCSAEKAEEAPEAETTSEGFPWWILLVVLVLVMIGALAALVVVLLGGKKQKGKFHR